VILSTTTSASMAACAYKCVLQPACRGPARLRVLARAPVPRVDRVQAQAQAQALRLHQPALHTLPSTMWRVLCDACVVVRDIFRCALILQLRMSLDTIPTLPAFATGVLYPPCPSDLKLLVCAMVLVL
jgi:hypothetical protein